MIKGKIKKLMLCRENFQTIQAGIFAKHYHLNIGRICCSRLNNPRTIEAHRIKV
jgi:hypothetical protein